MTFLLDTSVLIDVLLARNDRRALLANLIGQGHILSTTAINVAEVYAGMRPPEKPATESVIKHLQSFPIPATIGQRAGELKSAFAREGRTLDLLDMLVAAAALEHSLTLMTDNRKDFPVPGLALYPMQ